MKRITSLRELLQFRPKLFEGWMTLSTSFNKTNHAIHWIEIYPVDSVIHFSIEKRRCIT